MAEKKSEKPALDCHRSLFEFDVMPFALSNEPGVFKLLMAFLVEEFDDFATAYLDDIIIFSST